jgi:hypothetical protein
MNSKCDGRVLENPAGSDPHSQISFLPILPGPPKYGHVGGEPVMDVMCAVARTRFFIRSIHHNTRSARIDNPTAMAVAFLCASGMRPGPLLDGFLEAGGIAAVVRLLRKSTCPDVLVYTCALIRHVLLAAHQDTGGPGSSLALADKFVQAGEWETGSQDHALY